MTYKLPEGWREVDLGEIVNFRNGKKPKDIKELDESKYPLYGGNGQYGSVEEYNSENSLVIGRVGAYCGSVHKVKDKFWISDNAIETKPISEEILSHGFLYHKLNSLNLNRLHQGTSQPLLNQSILKNIDIKLPPLSEQKAIADTLSSLDNKIELNNKINQNLEQQAQAIFKHWFVDFEFPDENGKPYKSSGGEMVESELGMIPKGWEVDKLGNRLNVELGGTPARKNKSYWNGDINWINSGELNSYRIFKETEKITEDGLKNSSTKLWPKNTTVIAITGATLGKTSLLLIDTCANQSVVGIKESGNIPYTFVYPYILRKIPELTGHQTGGAQQHVNKGNVEDLILLLPNKELLLEYNNIIKSHYKLIEINEFENIKLSQLRDTLLPKLMSGELRIPLD